MGRAPVLVWLGLAGCLSPSLAPCGDLLCPDDTTCLPERGVCASPDALAVCANAPDGTPCLAPHIDGACDAGLCVASTCGDGITQGHEQCDGDATLTCADFRFYTGTLACTTACLYDTSGCAGRCGDGIVQEEAGEVCDGNLPDRGCADLGYDYGHLACTALCSDSSLLDCERYEPNLLFSPPLGDDNDIIDVWRENSVLAISRGDGGLVVIDHGTRFDVAGTFGRIARKAGQIAVAHGAGVDLLAGHVLSPLPAPGTVSNISGLAYAPGGNLWAISSTCEIRELVAGAWQIRPATVALDCGQLEIGADGTAYTVARGNGFNEVRALTGTGWVKVTNGNGARWIGPGAAGTVIASVDGALQGLAEITGTRATLVTDPGTYFEGVQLDGGTILAIGIELVRLDVGRAPLYFPVQREPLHLRAMSDGSILMWTREVTELGGLAVGNEALRSIRGVAADPMLGWIYWTDNAFGVLGAVETMYPMPSNVADVAAAGGTVYVASFTAVYSGPPDKLLQITPTGGSRVWADAAGDLVLLAVDGTIQVRAGATAELAALPPGCATGASDIAVGALDDIYAVRYCTGANTIEHWDGAGWTVVHTTTVNLSRGTVLPDGTAVFTGDRVAIGSGAQWTELDVTAHDAAGTSRDDLWLASAQLSSADPAGVVHYDGHTLARMRSPGSTGPTFLVVDARTAFVASYAGYNLIARFAVP